LGTCQKRAEPGNAARFRRGKNSKGNGIREERVRGYACAKAHPSPGSYEKRAIGHPSDRAQAGSRAFIAKQPALNKSVPREGVHLAWVGWRLNNEDSVVSSGDGEAPLKLPWPLAGTTQIPYELTAARKHAELVGPRFRDDELASRHPDSADWTAELRSGAPVIADAQRWFR
jgi:hypothetical protein